jgi:hypothetical protein
MTGSNHTSADVGERVIGIGVLVPLLADLLDERKDTYTLKHITERRIGNTECIRKLRNKSMRSGSGSNRFNPVTHYLFVHLWYI